MDGHPGWMISAATLSPTTLPATTAAPGGDPGAARLSGGWDAKAAAAADRKLQDLRDAVGKLKTAADSARSAGADLARQKLEALKQRLKMLLMMGGDPKSVAHEAAQIAKEIGEAAKAYAAAGGSVSTSQGAADVPPSPASADAAASPAPPDAPTAAPDAPAASPANAPAGPGDDKTAAKTGPAVMEEPTAKTIAPSGPSGPDPFITEAKQLSAQARAILKAAIARARREHADPQDLKEDQAKVDAAEKDVQDAARSLNATDATAAYSSSGEAAPEPAAATPAVSVNA